MTAGSIISGAYFGDKMSPLSDTTNLAPAVAGSELFEHIRHMAWTTTPSFVLALVLFSIVGFTRPQGTEESAAYQIFQETLSNEYHLSGWLLIPPALVVLLVLKKTPALPALLAGAAAGGLIGIIFQGQSLSEVLDSAMNGYQSATGVEAVDDLLSRGGMTSMFWTVGLILCALAYGGLMEKTGMLEVLASGILSLAHRTGDLIAATIATCIGMNAVAPDQYLSIVVPGRMYKSAFERMKLHPKNLSRVLEDAGTLTSPLILWNTCGATMVEVLGVSAFLYWRYCFFNLINPLVSLLYAYTGFTIVKTGNHR
jgi:NhaC family Na+:H+ antiporter